MIESPCISTFPHHGLVDKDYNFADNSALNKHKGGY
jgi:hypothetical protein